MKKEEYYKFSEDKKLPPRCPCLSNCLRYFYTAYYIGQTCYKVRQDNAEANMKEMGILGNNESISNMLEAGEPVVLVAGNSSFYITNACPEFFLHPNQHKLPGMDSIATHTYSYDEYFRGSKFVAGESRHYTECPEYSLFSYKNALLKFQNINVVNSKGHNNIINTGSKNTIIVTTIVEKGNFNVLKDLLSSNKIEDFDIQELASYIEMDNVVIEEKKFGNKVNSWIIKMLSKALNGNWDISVDAAGKLLTDSISSYYGWL